MGLTSKRTKTGQPVNPMTVSELTALAERLEADIRQSLTALAEVNASALDDNLLKDISQEGLTLSYRGNLLMGLRKLIAGKPESLSRTERGLLERNARIKPLIPDTDGGDD